MSPSNLLPGLLANLRLIAALERGTIPSNALSSHTGRYPSTSLTLDFQSCTWDRDTGMYLMLIAGLPKL